jgi:hypothetical protein
MAPAPSSESLFTSLAIVANANSLRSGTLRIASTSASTVYSIEPRAPGGKPIDPQFLVPGGQGRHPGTPRRPGLYTAAYPRGPPPPPPPPRKKCDLPARGKHQRGAPPVARSPAL